MHYQQRSGCKARSYYDRYYHILSNMIYAMTNAELTDSISHNFIVQMIPHHQAAIEMSENILRYTTDQTLRGIASDIVTLQTKSIADMQAVLGACSCAASPEQDLRLFQCRLGRIMRTMFAAMENAGTTNRLACDFMRQMIPHHRGAVEMAANTLEFEICPGLQPILDAIILSQQKGIVKMQNLLECLGCRKADGRG